MALAYAQQPIAQEMNILVWKPIEETWKENMMPIDDKELVALF